MTVTVCLKALEVYAVQLFDYVCLHLPYEKWENRISRRNNIYIGCLSKNVASVQHIFKCLVHTHSPNPVPTIPPYTLLRSQNLRQTRNVCTSQNQKITTWLTKASFASFQLFLGFTLIFHWGRLLQMLSSTKVVFNILRILKIILSSTWSSRSRVELQMLGIKCCSFSAVPLLFCLAGWVDAG